MAGEIGPSGNTGGEDVPIPGEEQVPPAENDGLEDREAGDGLNWPEANLHDNSKPETIRRKRDVKIVQLTKDVSMLIRVP